MLIRFSQRGRNKMKVLWVTNTEINSIARKFGATIVVGGWLEQTAGLLTQDESISLCMACNTTNEYFDEVVDGVSYYSFDNIKNTSGLDARIGKILDHVKPDVVHIWGTEYSHSLKFVNACIERNIGSRVVVSIQGMVSVYPIHFFANLPYSVVNHRTLKEFLRPNINGTRETMIRNGENEIRTIELAQHCIGRTDWDHACVTQINGGIHYYHVDEILREPFYEAPSWEYGKCNKKTIFFSQADYPVKAFHTMLQALPIIKKVYPDVVVNVLGEDPFNCSFKRKLMRRSYTKYIMDLIVKLGLKDNVNWLGRLDADQMVKQYLGANVFVCSSSIENSSNSIAEAMMLGVPVAASDVGGIKSFMTHEEDGIMFHDEAYYMLADAVMKIFGSPELASRLGENARVRALKIHDRDINMRKLMDVYTTVNEGKK